METKDLSKFQLFLGLRIKPLAAYKPKSMEVLRIYGQESRINAKDFKETLFVDDLSGFFQSKHAHIAITYDAPMERISLASMFLGGIKVNGCQRLEDGQELVINFGKPQFIQIGAVVFRFEVY